MHQVVIIGGGLAGLTAAIHLARKGIAVLVIEKKQYPQHKVCGEYISNEILPYYQGLGIPIKNWQPKQVERFRLHAPSGKWIEAQLPLGGFGMRRYTLDQNLFQLAQHAGVDFLLNTSVKSLRFLKEQFLIQLQNGELIKAPIALGSFGKRSNLDKKMERSFIQRRSHYVGVKFYLQADFPDDLVALYNFKGGYGGAVKVEDETVDVAYLASNRQLQRCGGLAQLEQQILYQNPAFKELLKNSKRLQAKPFTISNISFLPKEQVHQHLLMIGDAAGMIPPLCGNGMAMGIHAAKLAAESVLEFFNKQMDRQQMEYQYQKRWRTQFSTRLFWGRQLQPFMTKAAVAELAVAVLKSVPALLPPIIKQTHGTAFS